MMPQLHLPKKFPQVFVEANKVPVSSPQKKTGSAASPLAALGSRRDPQVASSDSEGYEETVVPKQHLKQRFFEKLMKIVETGCQQFFENMLSIFSFLFLFEVPFPITKVLNNTYEILQKMSKWKFHIEGTKSPSMFEMVSGIIMYHPHAKVLLKGLNSWWPTAFKKISKSTCDR